MRVITVLSFFYNFYFIHTQHENDPQREIEDVEPNIQITHNILENRLHRFKNSLQLEFQNQCVNKEFVTNEIEKSLIRSRSYIDSESDKLNNLLEIYKMNIERKLESVKNNQPHNIEKYIEDEVDRNVKKLSENLDDKIESKISEISIRTDAKLKIIPLELYPGIKYYERPLHETELKLIHISNKIYKFTGRIRFLQDSEHKSFEFSNVHFKDYVYGHTFFRRPGGWDRIFHFIIMDNYLTLWCAYGSLIWSIQKGDVFLFNELIYLNNDISVKEF